MVRLLTLSLAVSVTMLTAVHATEDLGEPSECAQGMPGAKGTFEFPPDDRREGETTWWKDTDGIAPETPGCHIGTGSKGVANGRKFGEACLPDGLLVESNPGAYVLHEHANDLGHPDTFDCNEWCIGTGQSKGECTEVGPDAAPPPCTKSAKCTCS